MGKEENKLTSVVIGATGGIGEAFVKNLSEMEKVKTVYALSRKETIFKDDKIKPYKIDITNEVSVEEVADFCGTEIDLVIVASGMLSDGGGLPEKSLRDIDLSAMQECFNVNTFGPALVAKHFIPRLPKDKKSIFACLSARVGSISDNEIGGWYSYRASKAALNMIIKTAAIETRRRYKEAIIVGLHPGTVDTALSKPFQSNVKHDIFSPEKAAGYLLEVLDDLKPENSGKCFDWAGKEILP